VKERYGVKETGKLGVIIMPAFNLLLGGTPVNVKKTSDELLGPLLRNNFVDMENAELYLLDGTFLGKLKYMTH
jgi:metallophosphoesterase superfamily enzyme